MSGFPAVETEFVLDSLVSFLLREFSSFLEFSLVSGLPFLLCGVEVHWCRPVIWLSVLRLVWIVLSLPTYLDISFIHGPGLPEVVVFIIGLNSSIEYIF